MSALPTRAISYTPDVAPHWEGAAAGRLVLPRCSECTFVIWYPRTFCPECGARTVAWFEAAGTGHVYSFSVSRHGQGAWRDAAPYVLAYVELDEGPRVLTNIVDCDPDAVHIGQRVRAVWDAVETADSHTALLRFRPA